MQEQYEYEEARRLLAPLGDEPSRPSTIDIQRAIADGRRRVRTRRVTGVGAVAAVAVLVVAGVPVARELAGGPDRPPPMALLPATQSAATSPSPGSPGPGSPGPGSPSPNARAAPERCELELLPEPEAANQSLVTAADPTGRLIAGRSYTEAPDGVGIQVVLWEDGGEPTLVDIPGLDPSLHDLNSRGIGVGTSYPASDVEAPTGWVYRDGEVAVLPGGGVSALDGLSINEQGSIAGAVPAAGSREWERVVPVVWWTPTSEPEQLSVPGPSWSVVARDVDADGTVVGSGRDLDRNPDAPDRSFVWRPDGTRELLPLPTIRGGVADSYRARTIHDGVITGEASVRVGGDGWEYHLVRYDLRTGEFTELSLDTPGFVEVWNRLGWGAGSSPDGLVLSTPFGDAVPLPDLGNRAGREDLLVDLVQTLSDDGRVAAGQVSDAEGNAHAAAWRCR